MSAVSVRQHTLSRGKGFLEAALTIFERLDERGLCDDLNQLIELVMERMTAEQEESAA